MSQSKKDWNFMSYEERARVPQNLLKSAQIFVKIAFWPNFKVRLTDLCPV